MKKRILLAGCIFLLFSCSNEKKENDTDTLKSDNEVDDSVIDVDFESEEKDDQEQNDDSEETDLFEGESPDESFEVVYDGDFIVEKHWTQQWGTRLDDRVAVIGEIKNDLIYISSATYGKMGEINYYNGDSVVQLFNRNGEAQNLIQWGTGAFDTLGELFVEEDGTIFTVGLTEGEFEGFINAGSIEGNPCTDCHDVFITKMDKDLNIIKTVQFGTPSKDRFYRIMKSGNEEELIVYGSIEGKFEENEYFGNSDVAIFVFDYDLVMKNTFIFGTEKYEYAKEMFHDSEGNVYISGITNGNLAKETEENHSVQAFYDDFLIKLDSNFNVVWKKQYFHKDVACQSHEIKEYSDGKMYSRGTCAEVREGLNRPCYYFRKIDKNGDELFFKKWSYDDFIDVFQFEFLNGLIFFSGYRNETVVPGKDSVSRLVLSATTLDGETVFEYLWGTDEKDYVNSIAIDGNEIFITGTTTGDLDGNTNLTGEKPDYEENASDFFMTKFVVKEK
ncbi:MAG TPA: hypothetical protein VLJ60_04155 [bacterium]|nr:hypothetical protein [bacterium]